LEALHARIDGDQELKTIRTELEKTAETRELIEFLELLNLEQFEYLAKMTKPDQLAELSSRNLAILLFEKNRGKVIS
jgi:ribosomal protein L4